MKGRGRYTKEFKIEAIRLLNSGDKPVTAIGGKGKFRGHHELSCFAG